MVRKHLEDNVGMHLRLLAQKDLFPPIPFFAPIFRARLHRNYTKLFKVRQTRSQREDRQFEPLVHR